MSAPAAVSPRARRPSIRAVVLVLLAAAAVGLTWFALPYLTLSPDARYSLAWGAQLAAGDVPDFAAANVSTAHPLPVALGVLLSPLGPGAAADAYAVLSVAAFGLLLYGAFRLGRALGGPWAGALALVLVATRPRLDFFAAHGFIDIPFAALVLLAAALAAEQPQARSLRALGLLALAGLLRPEAWGLAPLYAAWLAWAWRDDEQRVRRVGQVVALAVSAPLVWMLFDLVFAGDPVLSLTGTQERSDILARPSGIGNLLPELRSGLEDLIGWPLAAAGVVAGAWALARGGAGPGNEGEERDERRVPFALVVALVLAGTAAFAALALADLPLNDRYLIVPALALVALAAAGLPSARRSLIPALALGLALVGVALAAPDDYRETTDMLELSQRKHDADEDLERLLSRDDVRTQLRGCDGLVVADSARAAVAAELERDPARLPRATGPLPDLGQAAVSTSDTVSPDAPGATRVGAWTFVTRC
jgi:hypothetical protein